MVFTRGSCGGQDMAQLSVRAQRHPWLRYEVEGYTKEVVQNFEHRLARIFSRRVHRVQVLDFEGMTGEMGVDIDARFDDLVLDLVTNGVLRLQLGGARRTMSWSSLFWLWVCIPLRRLTHMGSGGTRLRVLGRDPLRRLCHGLITYTIAGRGQAPEKVTSTYLYFLRSMDQESVNLPYLLSHYVFRHAKGRKQGAHMSGGHFIA
ncbi:hypothetical protein Tco_0001111 [Tanacetum coccineum]